MCCSTSGYMQHVSICVLCSHWYMVLCGYPGLLLCVRGQMGLDPSATTFPPDASSIAATPFPSNTAMPTTEEDPIQRHLALIVGVPTGVGLALLGLCLCGVWLACSTYCDRRKATGDQSAGTHSTNLVRNRGRERRRERGKE